MNDVKLEANEIVRMINFRGDAEIVTRILFNFYANLERPFFHLDVKHEGETIIVNAFVKDKYAGKLFNLLGVDGNLHMSEGLSEIMTRKMGA